MTTKAKTTPKPEPITAPAIPADVAFSNRIVSDRDHAVIEEASLRNQLVERESYYDREQSRLIAERDAEINALNIQIAQRVLIQKAADAALEFLAPTKTPALAVAMAAE